MGLNLRASSPEEIKEEIKKVNNTKVKKNIDLNGMRVCITGTIPGMTRGQAQGKLENKYPLITFDYSITNNTDYLLTGFGIGQTKLKEANRRGIKIIEAVKYFN